MKNVSLSGNTSETRQCLEALLNGNIKLDESFESDGSMENVCGIIEEVLQSVEMFEKHNIKRKKIKICSVSISDRAWSVMKYGILAFIGCTAFVSLTIDVVAKVIPATKNCTESSSTLVLTDFKILATAAVLIGFLGNVCFTVLDTWRNNRIESDRATILHNILLVNLTYARYAQLKKIHEKNNNSSLTQLTIQENKGI